MFMFGVLVNGYYDEETCFKVFETMDEATEFYNNVSCMGYAPVMFDYDIESQAFIEFYS